MFKSVMYVFVQICSQKLVLCESVGSQILLQ